VRLGRDAEALALARQITGSGPEAARAASVIAHAARSREDWEDARRHSQIAADLWRLEGEEEQHVTELGLVAWARSYLDVTPDEAFRDVLPRAERFLNVRGTILLNYAKRLLDLGVLGRSGALLERASMDLERSGDVLGYAQALINRGVVLHLAGQLPEAAEMYRQAIDQLRGTGSVLVTVRTMEGPVHSGMYGGAAPDALQALLMALASLRDETGETTIDGLDGGGTWGGAPFDAERFHADAGLLEGVEPLTGHDASVADQVWARPAATVLAIDCPPVSQVTAVVQGSARAVVNLRVPAGVDAARAQHLLTEHLVRHMPFGAQVDVRPVSLGQPFQARTDGPAYRALGRAMHAAFGRDMVTTGQGGSIPLATALAEVVPQAEILLLGVEEPDSRIHGPNESVHPDELRRTALALALLLADLGGVLESG